MESDNYVVVKGWMCNELNLKGNELLVFALIYGFSQDGKSGFRGGRKYISETFNISMPTVDKTLQGLVDKQLVIKESSNDHVNTDTYRVGGSKETLLGVVKKLYRGSKETLPYNIYNSNSTKVEFNNTKVLVPKKKNLYEKCIGAIKDFTEDTEVKEALIDYLGIRLERKDIPLGFKSFEGSLKKLRKLTESKKECLQIIQQSIDMGYGSFFPLNKFRRNQGKGCTAESFELDHIAVVDEETKKRIKDNGQKF